MARGNSFSEEFKLGQQHEDQNQDLEVIVLEVHRDGEPPVKVEVPANVTGTHAAKLVSQHIGVNAGIWSGLRLVTSTGEKIPPEDIVGGWNGRSVRLGITHTSKLMGK